MIANPYRCPKCGNLLIRKEGRYGSFMACPRYPECRYTRAMWTYAAAGIKPLCEKCLGEGKLPFVKNGKTIPNVLVYCDCYQEPRYDPHPYSDDLIDFPISWDFHRALSVDAGLPDPGAIIPQILKPEIQQTPISFNEEKVSKELTIIVGEVLKLKSKKRKYTTYK